MSDESADSFKRRPRYSPTGLPIKPDSPRSGFFERLSQLLLREPEDREQLLQILQAAEERDLIDADALSMIEGVMQVSELSARDVMVPRAQMDMVDVREPVETIVHFAREKTHSRFPVYEGDRDHVIGVLLAKDLLQWMAPDSDEHLPDIRAVLRPAVFIPESKRLNVLLRDFRVNRNHIALVVDEYGGVAGLVTIEDVLEQIVGEIEDEYDFDEQSDHIVAMPADDPHSSSDVVTQYRVRALTEIDYFNEVFHTDFTSNQSDTIGGLIADHLGRVPKRGEVIDLLPLRFEVLRADARQAQIFRVERLSVDEHDDPDHAAPTGAVEN